MAKELFKAVIVGAGPAGLTAAYKLSKQGASVVVLESDPEYVGGISRTVNYKGFRFDIGGHRFFSKSREVEDLWTEIAGDLMLERPRSSRIFYNGQLYSYPLKAIEALTKLGSSNPFDAWRRLRWRAFVLLPIPRRSRIGWSISLAKGFSGYSSRPIPKKCGA
jgi:protoporphyrinogen oxidase